MQPVVIIITLGDIVGMATLGLVVLTIAAFWVWFTVTAWLEKRRKRKAK